MPSTAIQALQNCDRSYYPYVHKLLKLFAVTPTTSCEPERVFSQMKHIKSVLRSTMTQERMDDLMLLKIHPDIPVNIDNVVQAVISLPAE